MINNSERRRIWELDFFRGIALVLMIVFHVFFDMKDIYGYNVDYNSPAIYYTGRTAALLFMFISGISCFLSRSNIKRGIKVLALAMVLTLVTHLYGEGLGIKFGILHFLGVSMLLFPMLNRLNKYILILLGIIGIIVGNIFSKVTMSHDYFFIFNLTSTNFVSSDYYPLLPWLGVFLFGMSAGKLLYSNKTSIFSFSLQDNLLSTAGRNTLVIYMIHQPVIIAVLELIKRFKA